MKKVIFGKILFKFGIISLIITIVFGLTFVMSRFNSDFTTYMFITIIAIIIELVMIGIGEYLKS